MQRGLILKLGLNFINNMEDLVANRAKVLIGKRNGEVGNLYAIMTIVDYTIKILTYVVMIAVGLGTILLSSFLFATAFQFGVTAVMQFFAMQFATAYLSVFQCFLFTILFFLSFIFTRVLVFQRV